MATQDNNQGLLSKVAKFVRNPATERVELGRVEPTELGEHSKQALRQMIERKAQNDAVRKREFGQLRKLRSAAPGNVTELAARTSFFRDSTGSSLTDERAMTLKKIDEIEAHMSKQWWKGRQGATPAGIAGVNPAEKAIGQAPLLVLQPDTDSSFESTLISNLSNSVGDVPTQMGAATDADARSAGSSAGVAPSRNAREFELTDVSAFSASKMVSIDAGQSVPDPALEEASIRFANGDDIGAEAVLMAALLTPDTPPEAADIWAAALFDLYRGTGQQASFERMALDYAQRFDRSAPAWFSTPQALGLNFVPDGLLSPARPDGSGPVTWVCPAELDVQTVKQLAAIVVSGAGPYVLDWHSLKTIGPEAAKVLSGLFLFWCDQRLTLCFEGSEALEYVLRVHTPAGDSDVAQFWWLLRLDAMRILSMQDEFELVAMDFCVTYEVSPTPWKPARCIRFYAQQVNTQLMPMGGASGSEALFAAPVAQSRDHVMLLSPGLLDERHFEFSGDVLGDADAVLAPLQAAIALKGEVVVSCKHLIRVDFSAAGSILNWVANAQASGCRIELRDVPHLVAAFFNLIGINEHARIVVRSN